MYPLGATTSPFDRCVGTEPLDLPPSYEDATASGPPAYPTNDDKPLMPERLFTYSYVPKAFHRSVTVHEGRAEPKYLIDRNVASAHKDFLFRAGGVPTGTVLGGARIAHSKVYLVLGDPASTTAYRVQAQFGGGWRTERYELKIPRPEGGPRSLRWERMPGSRDDDYRLVDVESMVILAKYIRRDGLTTVEPLDHELDLWMHLLAAVTIVEGRLSPPLGVKDT